MNNKNWISVNESLPDDGKDYLVTDGAACMVAAFRTQIKKWDFFGIYWWKSEDVKYWMPLPKVDNTENLNKD